MMIMIKMIKAIKILMIMTMMTFTAMRVFFGVSNIGSIYLLYFSGLSAQEVIYDQACITEGHFVIISYAIIFADR